MNSDPVSGITYHFGCDSLDFDLVHFWLANTYWSPGIARDRVERGFRASTVVIAALFQSRLVGIARAISDTTRFAYIADVFVDEAFRGQGIARTMVDKLLQHPALEDVDSAHLLTKDAHGVYEELGFELTAAGRWMSWKRPRI